jgi:hypothetical protein
MNTVIQNVPSAADVYWLVKKIPVDMKSESSEPSS